MEHLKLRSFLAALALLFIASVLVCCGGGDTTMTAEYFLKDFNKDRATAYDKYKSKDILLTGKAVAGNKKYERGPTVLGLVSGDSAAEMVLCEFPESSPQLREALLKINDGEQIEVKGRLSSLSVSPPLVYLDHCQLRQ